MARLDEVFDTGFGELCEIEGLELVGSRAYILCKTARDETVEEHLTVLVWDVEQNRVEPDAGMSISWMDLDISKRLHPSALTFVDGQWLVLAARQQRWLLLDSKGQYLRGGKLPNRESHPQAEGVAVLGEFTYLADEGKKTGTLTRYRGRF